MIPYPLRQLGELCRAHPLEAKVLFVPSPRAGFNLTGALARFGRSWTNLRVTTPGRHAREGIRPYQPGAGDRRLDQEGRRWLVEAVLAGPAGEGIRPSTRAAGAGLSEALRRTFDELREAEVAPAEFGELPPGPLAGLGPLYVAYCRELLEQDWWDEARILGAAIDALEGGDAHPPAVWIITDETEMPPLAHRYVLAVSGGRLHRIGRDSYGLPAPAHSAAVRWARAPIPGLRKTAAGAKGQGESPHPTTLRPPEARSSTPSRRTGPLEQGDLFLEQLRAGERAVPRGRLGPPAGPASPAVEVAPGGRLLTSGLEAADRDRVRLWRTIGMETEIRAVVRDVLHRGLPLDEVEIAYTRPDPYRFLLFDAIERWGLPADFAGGVPVGGTGPGRALAAFLGWIRGGLDGIDLARGLRCEDMGWEDSEAPPRAVAHLLLAGRVGRGPGAAAEALDRVEGGEPDPEGLEPSAAAAAGRRLARVQRAREHLERLHSWVPEGRCSLASMADAAAGFLKARTPAGRGAGSDRDTRAGEVLEARLLEVSRGPELTGTPAEQASRLLDAVGGMNVDAQRASPGRLHVAPLDGAGYTFRRHLYVIGLDEAHFPGVGAPDPILPEESRRALGLRSERSRPGDAVFQLVRLLGAAAGEVTLVASSLHLADGREPYPTPLFELARDQLGIEPCWRRPLPSEPEGAADDFEIVLSHRGRPGYREAVAASYCDAERGARVQDARAASVPSRFDGWTAAPGEQALDLEGERTLSSRMLETLAACPRRYLWQDVLGVRALEEPERDSRRWLQPLEMGSLLHDLFLTYMQRLGERGDRPSAAHESELEELAAAAIARWGERIPAPLEAAFRNDCRRIERACRVFLFAEAQRMEQDPAITPRRLEWDFGAAEGVEVLLSPQVAFRLRGRIDRVDQIEGSDDYEVWDYKTGSTWGYDSSDLLAGGRNLQWALYSHALPRLLGSGKVRRAGYFFPSDRGSGQRFAQEPPAADLLAGVLQPLFGLAREGFFPALHKGDDNGGGPCRFCDYRRICADEARGGHHVDEMTEAAAHAAALVEGWAEAAAAGREQSRRALEAQLATLGLEPADAVPSEAVALAAEWMKG